jgi:hypothetical protein
LILGLFTIWLDIALLTEARCQYILPVVSIATATDVRPKKVAMRNSSFEREGLAIKSRRRVFVAYPMYMYGEK